MPKRTYTLDPSKSEWSDCGTVQAECGNLSGNELSHNLSENTRSQSSQLAEPLWTDPGLKSELSLRELISKPPPHCHVYMSEYTSIHINCQVILLCVPSGYTVMGTLSQYIHWHICGSDTRSVYIISAHHGVCVLLECNVMCPLSEYTTVSAA